MSEVAVFDKAVFFELSSELGQEDTIEVLNAFLTDTSRKMEIMVSGVCDRSTLKREAHSIKSSAATFGFAELSMLARNLEANSEAVRIVELEEFVEALSLAFERVSALARAQLLTTNAEMA